jgi:hypothetical protein
MKSTAPARNNRTEIFTPLNNSMNAMPTLFGGMLYRMTVRGLIVLYVSLMIGCQFAPQTPSFKWPWSKDEKKPIPERILPVWTDAVMHQKGKRGVRGFGGRIYFYESRASEPVEVDGGLAVYAFDAKSTDVHSQQPLKKFVFPADQFASHMSRTNLGPSYSVWLPWDEIGGPEQKLSLIVRFEGTDGGTTISDPTVKLLPGVPEKSVERKSAGESGSGSSQVELASHQASPNGPSQRDSGGALDARTLDYLQKFQQRQRSVDSIDLPPSFQRHLRSDDGSKRTENREQPASESLRGVGAKDAGKSTSKTPTLDRLSAPGTFSRNTVR